MAHVIQKFNHGMVAADHRPDGKLNLYWIPMSFKKDVVNLGVVG